MGLAAGNAAGYWGGVFNTRIENILVLPAVTVVSLLLGPALRDGFSHVLGLRIVVPEALRRPSGQLLRQRQPLVDLSILAPISRSLLCWFTRSVREFFARGILQFLRRLSSECVFRLLSTTESSALGSRCADSRALGGKLKLRMWSQTKVLVDENGTEYSGNRSVDASSFAEIFAGSYHASSMRQSQKPRGGPRERCRKTRGQVREAPSVRQTPKLVS